VDEDTKRMQERWIDATLALATAASQLREAVTELRACVEVLSMRLDRTDHAAE
jgi:hypothetical protein